MQCLIPNGSQTLSLSLTVLCNSSRKFWGNREAVSFHLKLPTDTIRQRTAVRQNAPQAQFMVKPIHAGGNSCNRKVAIHRDRRSLLPLKLHTIHSVNRRCPLKPVGTGVLDCPKHKILHRTNVHRVTPLKPEAKRENRKNPFAIQGTECQGAPPQWALPQWAPPHIAIAIFLFVFIIVPIIVLIIVLVIILVIVFVIIIIIGFFGF